MKNLLFFTSPIGLGHATRDVAIASRLRQYLNKLTFVSGQGASKLISDNEFDALDLYRHYGFDISNGEFRNKLRWLLKYLSYHNECKKIAKNVISDLKPDLIIGDEDYAAVTVAEKLKIPRVLITDIFDIHFTKGLIGRLVENRMNKALQRIFRNSDLVIIPDVGTDYDNVVFVGPIVRDVSTDRNSLRKRFGFAGKTILVTVGGTNAGAFLIGRVLGAFDKIKSKCDANLVIVNGPSLSSDTNQERVLSLGYVSNLHEMIYACDLLVSLAGRSTSDEAVAYGTPSIFIPIKGHFEQEENAKKFGFSFDDIYRLDELMLEKLRDDRHMVKISNGADKAANLILNLLT